MAHSLQIDSDSDNIATVWLDVNPEKPRGGVVVLDGWLVGALEGALDRLQNGPTPLALIVRSRSERVFVAGADLAEIDALDDAGLHHYLLRAATVFRRISQLPCPSVAIIHAAALGGGLEVAMHCDDLIAVRPAPGAKPWRVGLPECGLGICPGWGGTQCLGARIDPQVAFEATATGTTWTIDQAPDGLFLQASDTLVDAGVAARDAISRRLAQVQRRSGLPQCISEGSNRARAEHALSVTATAAWANTVTGTAVRDCVRRGLDGGFAIGCEAEREHLVRLRHTPPAREKLAAFLKR